MGRNSQLPPLLILEQDELIEALRIWTLAFSALEETGKPLMMALLEMRGLVWEVYAATYLDQDETVYGLPSSILSIFLPMCSSPDGGG